MATGISIPMTNTHMLVEGYSEELDSGVLVFEVERGLPKKRVSNVKTARNVTVTLEFRTKAAMLNFNDWYKNTIKKIGVFLWDDPRDSQTKTVSLKDGKLGALTPVNGSYDCSRMTVTLEYLE